jgi:tetratricopeptide (TPR) repeat protein
MLQMDASPTRGEQSGRQRALIVLGMLPAVAILGSWVAWISFDGGYFPKNWYPVAIGVVALLAFAVAAGWSLPESRLARSALALLAAFVAFNFLSIVWADAPGSALEAADKLLLFLATATALSLIPWTPGRAMWCLAAWALGTLALVAVTLADAASAANPASWFIEGRYAQPLGYAGGNAAVAAIAAWPALLLSTSRELPAPVRALLLGVAVVLAEFAVLPQSRGALIALVLMLPVALLLAPRRWTLVASLLAALGVLALTLDPVLGVYSAANEDRPVAPALDDAVVALLIAGVLATVAGFVLALVEARVSVPRRVERGGRFAVFAVAAVALLGVVAFALANADGIGDRWETFKSGTGDASRTQNRFLATDDPQRYDYWRVAIDVGTGSPLGGAGAGNFEIQYTERRQDEKHSRYAHNFWMRVLAENGVTGLILILAALACGALALWRGARRADPGGRVVATACAVGTAYFLIHASLDWVDEFPSVAAPGFGLLFLGLATVYPTRLRAGGPRRASRAWVPRATAAAALMLLAGGIAGLSLPYLSLRYTERAADRFRSDPEGAAQDLGHAENLNPLSTAPQMTEGAIAIETGRPEDAEFAFRRALETEDSWYPHFELALLASEKDDIATALREMDRVLELNSRDLFAQEIRKRLRSGERLLPQRVHQELQALSDERFFTVR